MTGRRIFVGVLIAAIMVAGWQLMVRRSGSPAEVASGSLGERPNIVWIVLDACRAENFSFAGYDRETSPNIDRLAERGAVFLNHFTQGVVTELSAPSYMTGRYFPVAALNPPGRVYPYRERPAGETLFPEALSSSGYHTACFSAHGMITRNSSLGKSFDEFQFLGPGPDSKTPYADFERLSAEVAPWLRSARDFPFLLYIHSVDTHFPHFLETPHDQWARGVERSSQIRAGQPVREFGSRFNEQDRELLRGLHDGSIHYVDHHIQTVLDALEEAGLAENTIVLITSDHGDALGEDGTSWGHWEGVDEVLHVPFVIAGPGIPQGRRVEALTENVDIVPTLMGLIGATPSPAVDGHDLGALMRDPQSAAVRDYAFTRYLHLDYDDLPGFLLRTPEHKFDYDALTDTARIWAVPDRIAQRRELTDAPPELVARFRRRMRQDLWPLWEAYASLDKRALDVALTEDLVRKVPANAAATVFVGDEVVPPDVNEDGKWLFHDGALWSAGWAESAPPVTLSIEAPAGRYIVQVEILAGSDYRGHPASSIVAVAEEQARRIYVTFTPVDDRAPRFTRRTLGVYAIEDGVFDVTIVNGQSTHWSAVRSFRFIPVAGETNAQDWASGGAQEESLKALGYLP